MALGGQHDVARRARAWRRRALVPAIEAAIWSVDKDQPIVARRDDGRPRRQIGGRPPLRARSSSRAFALVALVLAAIGIYGVLSGSVTERMREIGVRAALGASPRKILVLVLRQGMTLTIVGIIVGLGGAIVASRALVTLLFGVTRLDPVTYVGVIVLLATVSAVACWVPAWRAARVDPATTLRA